MPKEIEKAVVSDPARGMYRVRNLYFDPNSGRMIVEYELPRGEGEVAIQSFQLDPNAASYTDDEIVGKVNAASATITRAGSVDSAARPIGAGEVTNTELDAGVAKANLDAMADTQRGYIKTNPTTGEYPVISVHRQSDGKLDVEYDDQPIP